MSSPLARIWPGRVTLVPALAKACLLWRRSTVCSCRAAPGLMPHCAVWFGGGVDSAVRLGQAPLRLAGLGPLGIPGVVVTSPSGLRLGLVSLSVRAAAQVYGPPQVRWSPGTVRLRPDTGPGEPHNRGAIRCPANRAKLQALKSRRRGCPGGHGD